MTKPSLGIIFLLVCFYTIDAQTVIPDSINDKSSLTFLKDLYFRRSGENYLLNNGREYIRSGIRANGNPYLDSTQLVKGSVYYDGFLFDNVDLLYDMVTESLVSNNFQKTGLMELVPEKINYFILLDHRFVRLTPDTANTSNIKEGFYEELFSGKIRVFAKKIKKLELLTRTDELAKINQYVNYYIFKDNRYFEVSSENDVLNVFSDKRDQLKKYLHLQHVKFRKNFEGALTQSAKFYAQT